MIRLRLKDRPPGRLSLDGIIPERLAGLSDGEIERLELRRGNRRERLGNWFAVDGSGERDRLVIEGDCGAVDWIGAGMTSGELVVEGDAGAAAGQAMGGGRLRVAGSAGHGAAAAMLGGEIRIDGDAGDQLGGALPGERDGMRDGIVIVGGNAGSGAGDRMRRGLLVVGGAAGPFCAARMAAGTIVVGGLLGAHPGVAMRRGSLVALGGALPPPSFVDGGRHELTFLRLLARVLAGSGAGRLAERIGMLHRWSGDLATGGRGEILAPP